MSAKQYISPEWNAPTRIRRMSKRRQKKAIVRWIGNRMHASIKAFVGQHITPELRQEAERQAREEIERTFSPPITHINLRISKNDDGSIHVCAITPRN